MNTKVNTPFSTYSKEDFKSYPVSAFDPDHPWGDWVPLVGGSGSIGQIGNDLNANTDGVIQCNSGSGSELDYSGVTSSGSSVFFGNSTVISRWYVKITNLSVSGARYTLQLGYQANPAVHDIESGLNFAYEDTVNSGQWIAGCISSGVSATPVSGEAFTSLAVTANTWYELLIVSDVQYQLSIISYRR
jgi:hypothetical protein